MLGESANEKEREREGGPGRSHVDQTSGVGVQQQWWWLRPSLEHLEGKEERNSTAAAAAAAVAARASKQAQLFISQSFGPSRSRSPPPPLRRGPTPPSAYTSAADLPAVTISGLKHRTVVGTFGSKGFFNI